MMTTTDDTNATARDAVGTPVDQRVRPQDPKREALDREAWEALGFLSGLHPCMTVDWDRPMTVARTVWDAVQAEIREWQRRATDGRLQVEQMNRLYIEKTRECERLRAQVANLEAGIRELVAASGAPTMGPNAEFTGRQRRSGAMLG